MVHNRLLPSLFMSCRNGLNSKSSYLSDLPNDSFRRIAYVRYFTRTLRPDRID